MKKIAGWKESMKKLRQQRKVTNSSKSDTRFLRSGGAKDTITNKIDSPGERVEF
jgi:hypothetical protein